MAGLLGDPDEVDAELGRPELGGSSATGYGTGTSGPPGGSSSGTSGPTSGGLTSMDAQMYGKAIVGREDLDMRPLDGSDEEFDQSGGSEVLGGSRPPAGFAPGVVAARERQAGVDGAYRSQLEQGGVGDHDDSDEELGGGREGPPPPPGAGNSPPPAG